MNSRTGSFLSALVLSTALLAELAAPKHRREHCNSFEFFPAHNPVFVLKDENRLPPFVQKPLREPAYLAFDPATPARIIISKSHSFPSRRFLIPYIEYKIDTSKTPPLLKPPLFKQFSFSNSWLPHYSAVWIEDRNFKESRVTPYLAKTIQHNELFKTPLLEYIPKSLSSSTILNFTQSPDPSFVFAYPAYLKPSTSFEFRFSSISLKTNSPCIFPTEKSFITQTIIPTGQLSKATPSKSALNDLSIAVRLPESPIAHNHILIPFKSLCFKTANLTFPSTTLPHSRLSFSITHDKPVLSLPEAQLVFTCPHMQPEKVSVYKQRQNEHFLAISSSISPAPALFVEPSICHKDAIDMLYSIHKMRIPMHAFTKVHLLSTPAIHRSLTYASYDPPLDASPTSTQQQTHLANLLTTPIQSLPLDRLPLTITLPTLADAGFTLKMDHVTLDLTSFDSKSYPKYQRCAVNLQALIEMQDMPLAHLVKSKKPLFAPAFTRPRSVETNELEWANQNVRLPTLILGSTPTQVPIFSISAAPDPRTLYRYSKSQHTIPTKHLDFLSELIATIELPVESIPLPSKAKQTTFLPSIEVYAMNRITPSDYICLQSMQTPPTRPAAHQIGNLDFSNDLITSQQLMLHPASHSSLSAQIQATLLVDAKHEQQMAKKRLTPDQYIRKYGHFPAPEKNVLSFSEKTVPLPIQLDPIPDGTPCLWNDPALVEDVSAQAGFAERKHQRRSDKLNRRHRVTATNLARIPTLFDLETTSLNQEFITSVSWLPKAADGKYLFSITVKPTPNTTFERLEQNVYFVIDNSTSINKGKATAYKSAIARALPYVHKNDRFNIFVIDDDLHAMSPTNLNVSASTKALAREYLEKQKFFHPYKTSNIYAQLLKFSQTLQDVPGLHTVYLFTDGASLHDLNKYLSDAHALINHNKTACNIYPTCVGNDNHISFIQMFSTLQRGEVMHSPTMAPFPRKFAGFVKKHQQPIACDLHAIVMSTNPDSHLRLFTESPHLPTFYANKPLTIYGETDTLSDLNLMIQGRFGASFVNISKKITFDRNLQNSSAFRQEGARFQAATYFLEFLQTKDSEPLNKANALLMRYGGHKLL